jgi:small subunit ribosomal protein S5
MEKTQNHPPQRSNTSGNQGPAMRPRAAGGDRRGGRGGGGERRGEARRGKRRGGFDDIPDEFEQRIIEIARVTRVMAGGKRMRFRACVALGNKKGKVGIGLAKGADVTMAVTKAVNQAKKSIIDVPIWNDTIPHDIYEKYGAAKVLLKPASRGRGVIAGGAVRLILELSGIKNVTSKILGTNSKINNARCVLAALQNLKKREKKIKEGVKEGAKEDANTTPLAASEPKPE